jgi:pyruvate ferredoxin oxidoreductase gamma subunit
VKEIRIHARAGQGAITAAMLLAGAAFEEGKHALAFPHFGSERMGAPLNAFVRLNTAPIRLRTQIRHPDYVLVQDATLLRGFDVASGLKPGGVIIVNTEQDAAQLKLPSIARVVTVPASRIAEEIIGRADRANTALLGAFSAATEEVSLEALKKVVRARFPGEEGERNAEALQQAYMQVKNQK